MFSTGSYSAFIVDTRVLWKFSRMEESRHLLQSFWKDESMLDITSNLSIALIDESDLHLSNRVLYVQKESCIIILFSIFCKSGRGAFSQVLLGTWAGQQVAVKCMHGADSDDEDAKSDALRLLHDEVNIVGKLRHPNVMGLLGVCAAKLGDGRPFSCEKKKKKKRKEKGSKEEKGKKNDLTLFTSADCTRILSERNSV